MSGPSVLTQVLPLQITLGALNLTFVAVVGLIAVIALAMAVVFRREVLSASEGTANMQQIALAVQEGASAYLTRQFRTLSVFAVAAFLLLLLAVCSCTPRSLPTAPCSRLRTSPAPTTAMANDEYDVSAPTPPFPTALLY